MAFNRVTKASEGPPLKRGRKPSTVVGKSRALVPPVTEALPAVSTATAAAPPLRPRNVEYTRPEPVGFSFVTKTSLPVGVVAKAPGVVGKLSESVPPET